MRLAMVVTILAFLPAVAEAQVSSAAAPRNVVLARSHPRPLLPDDPVEIVRVLYGGVEVKTGIRAVPSDEPGSPFEAPDDWFSHLTVVLKNISAKNIVYAGIQVFFPEIAGVQNEIGDRPRHDRSSGAELHPILIEPGQEFSLPAIDPERLDEVKQTIENRESLSSVTSLWIELGTVYFEDGTKWAGGVHYGPDFSAPRKYIVISQKEFDAYRPEASQ